MLAFAITPTLFGPVDEDLAATRGKMTPLEQRINEAKEVSEE